MSKLKTMLKTANVKLGRVWREETRNETENKERGGEGGESGGDKRVS